MSRVRADMTDNHAIGDRRTVPPDPGAPTALTCPPRHRPR